jgi:hypothetical protein
MGERVLTVGGNKATRPISEFLSVKQKEWFVGPNETDDGDDARSGRSKETSLATLDAAIDLAVASADSYNDVIHVLPGHAETVSSAGMINLDKIGLQVICHGTGALRPTFTFSAVDATILMTAASTSIKGFPILIPSIDEVVSGIVISAANCMVEYEVQDANDIEFTTAVLTTAAADNLILDMKYIGDIGGDACIAPIQLVGVNVAKIHVDFYGVADTAIVNFITTPCTDIDVTGYFHNVGTALTKSVVDTEGNGSWSVRGWDGVNNATFSGGDNAAVASDDIATVAAAVAVIDGLHDVPTANAETDLYIRDVVGRKTDAAVGAVAANKSLMAYIKGILEDTLKLDGVTLATAPVAASLASFIASGGIALGTQLPDSTSLYGVVSGVQAAVASSKLGLKVVAAKADILDGTTKTLFTVAGGKVLITAIVMENHDGITDAASDVKFIMNPTVGTDADMNTATAVGTKEVGSIWTCPLVPGSNLGGGSGGGGQLSELNGGWVSPEGTIDVDSSADTNLTNGATQSVEIYYIPLDAGATIVAI